MEARGISKSWRNTAVEADIISDVADVRYSTFGTDDEETDEEDSLFDLVIKSPDRRAAEKRDDYVEADSRAIGSPRDVLQSKNNFSSYKPQSPVTILRSAPKIKVFMLGFKSSSKCEKTDSNAEQKASAVNQLTKSPRLEQSKCFSVKTRQEEMPLGPVFARDNSLRSKMLKESCDYHVASSDVVSSEKSVSKYLKLIKPFYVKATSKTKLANHVTPSSSPVTAPVNLSPRKFPEVSRVGSFKIMARSLGKSRSASAADGVAPPSMRRRDDSLLEQHDGIQGAILHCKNSYYSSSYQGYSKLCRVTSDSSDEKLRRNSCEEQKRCSI